MQSKEVFAVLRFGPLWLTLDIPYLSIFQFSNDLVKEVVDSAFCSSTVIIATFISILSVEMEQTQGIDKNVDMTTLVQLLYAIYINIYAHTLYIHMHTCIFLIFLGAHKM